MLKAASFQSYCKSYIYASASAEHSFSSLKRLKTHVRSTMPQEQLDNISLLHIKRDLSNKLWDNIDNLVLKFFMHRQTLEFLLSSTTSTYLIPLSLLCLCCNHS